MIYILEETISQDIIDACGAGALANILSIVKTILNIIQIVGPILAIVSLIISFTRLMANPDEKKYKAGLRNSIIALVLLFFLPFLVNLTMSLVDGSFDLATCWNHAEEVATIGEESNYVDIHPEDEPKQIITESDLEIKITEDDDEELTGESEADKVIFVGDSRTVGMHTAVGDQDGDVWSAQVSQGYAWMESTGIPAIESEITDGSAVVILLGVNDLGNVNNYISYLNTHAPSWKAKGAKVYFVSVNPTANGASVTNAQIESFNTKIRNATQTIVSYIDTYSYLQENGYDTTDGIHYTTDTYKKIYNYIKSHV